MEFQTACFSQEPISSHKKNYAHLLNNFKVEETYNVTALIMKKELWKMILCNATKNDAPEPSINTTQPPRCKWQKLVVYSTLSWQSWSSIPISWRAAMLEVPPPLAAAACFSRLGALRLHRLGPPGTPSTTRVMICPRSRWCSVLGPHVLPFTPSAGTTNTRIIKSSSSYQKPTNLTLDPPMTFINALFLQNS